MRVYGLWVAGCLVVEHCIAEQEDRFYSYLCFQCHVVALSKTLQVQTPRKHGSISALLKKGFPRILSHNQTKTKSTQFATDILMV